MVKSLSFLRRHFMLICIALLFAHLFIHMISGRQGMFQIAENRAKIVQLQTEILDTQAQRVKLEQHANQLRARHLGKDRLDEESRRHLGFSHVNDLVIILDE